MKYCYSFFIFVIITSCGSNQKNLDKNTITLDKVQHTAKLEKGVLKSYDTPSALGKESLQANKQAINVDEIGLVLSKCLKPNQEKDALSYLKTVAIKYRKSAVFWNVRGVCEYQWKKFDLAELSWRKSIQLDKKSGIAFNNLGVYFREKNDHNQALDFFKKSNALERFAFTPLYNMALLYLEHGHAEKALDILKGIDLGNKNDDRLNAILALAYLMSGDSKNAVKLFSKIDQQFLIDGHWGLNYAYALYLEGDYVNSRRIISTAKWNQSDEMVEYFKGLMFLLGKKV